MATEKKQSFFGGAAVLAAGVVIVKIIGALFKIPLANILGETGNAMVDQFARGERDGPIQMELRR